MKHAPLCLGLPALLLLLGVGLAQEAPKPAPKAGAAPVPSATAPVSTAVDPKLKAALTRKVARKAFRTGHVKPYKLAKIKPIKRLTGYSVQLPSRSPIPTPAVYRGNVYVGGGFNSKTFFCLDGATGKPVWGVHLDDDGPSAPVCADGLVVFNTESCTIFALDAATGKHRWSHYLGDPQMAMPAIADGRVYTSYPRPGNAPASHVLACLELKTGKLLWERWIDSEVMSAPVVARGKVFVNTFSGHAYVFDPRSGALDSVRRERATSAPTIARGGVAMSRRVDTTGKRPLEAFVLKAARTGVERVRTKAREAVWLDKEVQRKSKLALLAKEQDAGNGFAQGAPKAANAGKAFDNVGQASVSSLQGYQGARPLALGGNFFRCDGDRFSCVTSGGKRLWSFRIRGDLIKQGGFLATPPLAAGGFVFTATLRGELLQVAPATGKVVKRYSIGAGVRFQPVAMGGRVYVTTTQGTLVCIDTKNPKVTGWPMWGKDAAHTNVQPEG